MPRMLTSTANAACALLSAALVCLLLTSCGPGPSRPQGLLGCLTALRAVAVTGSEGWAVGIGFTGGDLDFRPHCTDTLHLHDGQASQVAAPADISFTSVFALSPTDIWAGADNGNGFYHSDGTHWTHDPFVVPPGSFSGADQTIESIAMDSPTDGWALVDNRTGNLLHYTAGKWQVGASIPADDATGTYSQLSALTLLSATDGWAVGGHFIVHYDGTSWQPVASPVATRQDVVLTSVAMVAPGEGWAAGYLTDALTPGRTVGPSPVKGIILHAHGGVWSITDTPTTIISTLAMVSPTEGWAGGLAYGVGSSLLHLTSGQWTLAPIPNHTTILSLAMASADDGWAVSADALYHYQHGAWQVTHARGPNEPGAG